jgi:hypothetical protein
VEFVMGHAAWTIQRFVRGTFARRERQQRARAKQERLESGAALAVQRAYRIVLAMKRVAKRKREILATQIEAKKQAERDKVAKMRALQREKKKAAAAAAAKRRQEKQTIEEAERKRRGY